MSNSNPEDFCNDPRHEDPCPLPCPACEDECTCTPLADRPAIRYVNAYAVGRCYGGPEEGGWYFDAGTPLASIPVVTDEEEEAARARLRDLFAQDYKQPFGRTRSSVIGGDDLEIYTEDETAAPFPTHRPHYE